MIVAPFIQSLFEFFHLSTIISVNIVPDLHSCKLGVPPPKYQQAVRQIVWFKPARVLLCSFASPVLFSVLHNDGDCAKMA